MATEAEQQTAADPFAGQREQGEDPFTAQKTDEVLSETGGSLPSSPTSPRDRRGSKEWGELNLFTRTPFVIIFRTFPYQSLIPRSDASKVPPSQFQKRKGSLYSTPGSRDSHVDSSKTRDKSFHEKLKEKGWLK
ncbi:hypothetical protein MMC10_005316 [Thelotrema lepadinum]|nr:hypothetical protein [Thelotrema lepadinum]